MIDKLFGQIKNNDLKSISGMDATFLYAEKDNSPMHIGAVAIIEGDIDYASFREKIRKRLHFVPKLRQRLMYVPFSMDYPYWVDDPHFDLSLHVHRIALPKPGSWKELRAVASTIFSEPLTSTRPLWSITFVEGLDNIAQVPKGSVAIIPKVHHVAIDGVAGAGLLGLMFDMTDQIIEEPEPPVFKPKPLPNDINLLVNSAVTFAKNPLKFPKIISQALSATAKAGFLTRAEHIDPPTAPFSAPPSPLNGIISPKRKWNTTILSLERIKAIKNTMGTTLNDVILAICGGALRRYLDEKGQLPKKPLVAMVPISTAGQQSASDGANRLSSMLVQLATNIKDPIERLEMIHENTVRSKEIQSAIGAKTLASMAEAVPFGVANQAARLYSRYRIAERHNPVFNVTITNVPGPQLPLYINGHKLLNVMGMAPIIDGMGLIISIFSYDGKVTVSPTSDAYTMPDIDVFTRYLRESANELEEHTLTYQKKRKGKGAKKVVKAAKSDKFFTHIKAAVKADPSLHKIKEGVFQFDVTGTVPTQWKVDLGKPTNSIIRKGSAANADVTFTVSDSHLMKIARGELDVATAVIQGRLKFKGDMDKAMKMGKMLAKIPAFE